MSDRLIFIAGTPAGGTSCVAGVLHHLGVDMGEITVAPGIRGYPTYEDTLIGSYKIAPPEGVSLADGQRCHFPEYIQHRLELADGKPAGVKCAATYWYGHDVTGLPLNVIIVNRPLEDTVVSNVAAWKRIHDQRGEELTVYEAQAKAAAAVTYWYAKTTLRQIIRPVIEIDFYDVLECPMDAVVALSSTLDLRPTTEQERAATRFIDPEMRNV